MTVDMDESRSAAPIFFSKTYDEALGLLYEARDYFAHTAADELGRLPEDAALAYSRETLALTSRLTHIMTWLFVQRAVHAGEIRRQDAASEDFSLRGYRTALMQDPALAAGTPPKLKGLLERSVLLFRRIARLDELVARDAL